MNNRTKMFVACGAIFLFIVTLFFLELKRGNLKTDFTTMLQNTKQTADSIEREDYAATLGDTFGGTTPEEVLALYRKAVVAGNYTLASSYFIADKQMAELKALQQAETVKLSAYLGLIEQPAEKMCIDDHCTLSIKLDGPDYFMRFKQYPNKLWKIIEL